MTWRGCWLAIGRHTIGGFQDNARPAKTPQVLRRNDRVAHLEGISRIKFDSKAAQGIRPATSTEAHTAVGLSSRVESAAADRAALVHVA